MPHCAKLSCSSIRCESLRLTVTVRNVFRMLHLQRKSLPLPVKKPWRPERKRRAASAKKTSNRGSAEPSQPRRSGRTAERGGPGQADRAQRREHSNQIPIHVCV